MNKKRLESFKKLLQNELNRLTTEVVDTVVGMSQADNQENLADSTDRAALECDRNFVLRIRDRERKLASKVKEALDKIEKGTYGICEKCSGPITEKRLRARPVTQFCIACKEESEAEEKKKLELE